MLNKSVTHFMEKGTKGYKYKCFILTKSQRSVEKTIWNYRSPVVDSLIPLKLYIIKSTLTNLKESLFYFQSFQVIDFKKKLSGITARGSKTFAELKLKDI